MSDYPQEILEALENRVSMIIRKLGGVEDAEAIKSRYDLEEFAYSLDSTGILSERFISAGNYDKRILMEMMDSVGIY